MTYLPRQFIVALHKNSKTALLCSFVLICSFAANAQVPKISYQTPQIYKVNTAITPLAPVNTGGVVPPTIYGETTTYSGTVSPGNINGPALSASFRSPTRLFEQANGDIFIADRDNNQIRKVSAAGQVTTITSTGLNQPNGVVEDAAGNLFVADAASNSIKKIDTAGVVTTFAGSGNPSLGDGTGIAASFYYPYGIAIDVSGNLYVADSYNNAIRKITPAGVVTTFAGSGSIGTANGTGTAARFFNPSTVNFGSDGNLYVSDAGNYLVRKITPAGLVSTVAGTGYGSANGPIATASFNTPAGVASDIAGNVWVADISNNMIRKIDPSGIVTTIAGSTTSGSNDGVGNAAMFNRPNDVQFDPTGFLFVTDYGNNLIRKLITTGYAIDKTLPAGLIFDATTGIISGTPTVMSDATDYTVTAYNLFGSSSTVVNIAVIDPEAIIFNPIPAKTVCAADFDPGAAGSNIIYTSSNTAVATIIANKVHVTGPGTSVITAANGTHSLQQTLTVAQPTPTPIVSIAPDNLVVCAGTPVVFTASIVGSKTNNSYQWQVNHINAGSNQSTYKAATLVSSDIVQCMVTNTDACPVSGTSNTSGVTVNPYVSPSVSISVSPSATISAGSSITFTATPSPYGNNPGYQWQLNGVNVGDGSATYINTCPKDGDQVNVMLTVTGGLCLSTLTATSNIITEHVIPSPTPTVSISQSPAGAINAGTTVTFTATPSAAGNNPSYQWQLNGVDVGNGGVTYANTCPHNGDQVLVVLTVPGTSCLPVLTATSNTITENVLPIPAPSVSIGQSPAGTVNAGTTVTFTATPGVAGNNLSYQWQLNGVNVGNGGVTYANTCPHNSDQVLVVLTVPGTSCLPALTGTSNTITESVLPIPAPSVSISQSPAGAINAGTTVNFTATPGAAGNNPSYQWQLNGTNVGDGSATYTNTCLNNGDQINVLLTVPGTSCLPAVSATSNTIIENVIAGPLASVVVTASATSVHVGTRITFTATVTNVTAKFYQWQVNGHDTGANSASFTTNNLADADYVDCIVTTTSLCQQMLSSQPVNITILPPVAVIVPNTFTPNGDGVNDLWDIPTLSYYPNCTVTVVNRYGIVVYQSNGYSTSWDGVMNGKPLPASTYYYIIALNDSRKEMLSGHITVLR